RIQEQLEDAEADDGSAEFQLSIGGQLNLDVRLVVIRELTEDDLGERVDYKIENTQTSNATLRDIQSRLSGLANDCVQKQAVHVDARKEAIDKMFEGRDKRPTGQQIEHTQFEMAFEWHREESENDEEGEDKTPLRITTTAFVETKEPRKLFVRTEANARDMIVQPDISVSQEGPRVGFAVSTGHGKSLRWQDDSGMCQQVNSLCVKGLPGMAFLRGETTPW
ncbi:MAG: hypothetical protein QGG64_15280, partial [Candidatus Latescibacteria bacterium]|nr:hypothetical protein [Candidatus Latescibacterota bacterium]